MYVRVLSIIFALLSVGLLIFGNATFSNAQQSSASNCPVLADPFGFEIDIASNATQVVNGSIAAFPTILKGVTSQLNISLVDAVANAIKVAGNSSQVLDANLAIDNGFIVYQLVLTSPDPNFSVYGISVDPGNGDILKTCRCKECKPLGNGELLCTGCECTSKIEVQ